MRRFGQYVVARRTDTGVYLRPGDRLTISASGRVNFGGGVFGAFEPVLTADGDGPGSRAPSDYPAPHLSKNSLLFSVGGGPWQQGRDGDTEFTVPDGTEGHLVLNANDAHPDDNRDGWSISVAVQRPDPHFELPHPRSSGALLQDVRGDLALVFRTPFDNGVHHPGDLVTAARAPFAAFLPDGGISTDAQRSGTALVNPPREDLAYQHPSWTPGPDGWFWGVARRGTGLVLFGHGRSSLRLTRQGVAPRVVADGCSGAPAIAASRWGQRGNFEIAAPLAGGGLAHFFADTSGFRADAPNAWRNALRVVRTDQPITTERVHAVRLLHAEHYENLEVVTLEEGSPRGPRLVHRWGTAGDWRFGAVLPGSEGEVTGVPAFIQTAPRRPGEPGDLVVICPRRSGGLLQWTRAGHGPWTASTMVGGRQDTVFSAVHLAQVHFRRGAFGNFDLVAEAPRRDGRVGAGEFFFAFQDNSAPAPAFSPLTPFTIG